MARQYLSFKRLSLGCILLALFGCKVGPEYHPVNMEVAEDWNIQPADDSQTILTDDSITDWWNIFEDPLLETYISWTASYNYDVQIAETNIIAARALSLIAKSAYYPDIEFQLSALRTQLSKNGPFGLITGLGGPNTGLNNLTSIIPPFKFIQNLFNVGFDVTWEIDIFGKIARSMEAAEARIGSSIENRNDILITAFGEVAQNYIQIRGLQKRLQVIQKNVEVLEKISNIVNQRKQKGLDNALDSAQADAALDSAQAEIPNVYAQIEASIFSISVLTGHFPEELSCQLWEIKPLSEAPVIVPIGLKSDLLRRRPDIRKAERDLAAATADIGIAVADFYPSFSLTPGIGLQSEHFKNWFQARSLDWTEEAVCSMPVYRGGKITSNVNYYKALQSQAALKYEKTVLDALQETQTNLVKYLSEMDRRMKLEATVASSQRVFDLATDRYRKGLTDLKTTLDFERSLLSSQEQLVDSETTALINLVSLYKALGGGWEIFCTSED